MIDKVEDEKCLEDMRIYDDCQLPNYNEKDNRTYIEILKDYDSVHDFVSRIETKHDLNETLADLQDCIMGIKNDLNNRLKATANQLKFKARQLFNEIGNFSQDTEKEVAGSLDVMIKIIEVAYKTLNEVKISLDDYDERLMNIRAVANKIQSDVKRYSVNDESQKEKVMKITEWIINKSRNGTAYIIEQFLKIRIWSEKMSVLTEVEMKSVDDVINAIKSGLDGDLEGALKCLIMACENYLKQ